MRFRTEHPAETSGPQPGIAALFGIAAADPSLNGFHVRRLGRTRGLWPVALAAQIGVLAVLALLEVPSLLSVAAMIAAAASSLGIALLLCRVAPAPSAYRTVRALAAAVTLDAGALVTLIERPLGAAGGVVQLALLGTLAMVFVAVQPVRAATLAAALGLTGALAHGHAGTMPLLAALPLVALLAVIVMVRARRAVAVTIRVADQAGEGRLAAKMIAAYEDHGTGWFWETDADGRLTYLSAKIAAELGCAKTPIGHSFTEVFRLDRDQPGTERTLAFHLASRTSFSDYPVRCATPSAAERCWSISGRPALGDEGEFQGFVGSGTDLTEKRRAEAEITRLALFDGLTGLANRQRMRLMLDKALDQRVAPYRPTTLFLLDLDRFKQVNDTLGHQAGDTLLKQVAQRLERGVGGAGLVGRIGGDEFQVLIPDLAERTELSALARDVIAALSEPYLIAGASVAIGCSIGIALAEESGADSETLIRNADLALYAAKADGRGVHRFYSDEMLADAQGRKQLEDDLRQAVVDGGFHLCYQPVVSTEGERVVGYEALIRWDHATRGPVSPTEFIPVAEDSGLIGAIGEWVLRTACLEASRWPIEARVAVNVSPIQFANPNLPGLVTSALAHAGLAPDRLELEITEGVFLDENQSSDRMFKALKAIGVRLALDDFGTGYSSLGYLRTAPFDKIKIDQSFVRGAAMPGNRNAAIIRAIVTLAETLGMETTAEGVELQDEVTLVRALGCSHIQGYVYGRPQRTADVVRQLTEHTGAAIADGYQTSRATRHRMLRSARIAVDNIHGDVRIRNISAKGAMIEGIAIEGRAEDVDVMIELVENQMHRARVRWADGTRAGIEFAEQIDLDMLAAPIAAPRPVRRSA